MLRINKPQKHKALYILENINNVILSRPCVFVDHSFVAFRVLKLIQQPAENLHFERSTFYTSCTVCIEKMNPSKFKLSASCCINLRSLDALNHIQQKHS